MRHVFLINQYSACKDFKEISKKIEKACKELNIDYVIEHTTDNNTTENILKQYIETENIIIAVRWRWNN